MGFLSQRVLPFVVCVFSILPPCPGLTRASTTFLAAKTWMAGTSPAMTIIMWLRPRDSRNRAASHQPGALADAAEVVIRVAEGVLDHGQPLEVVADLGLHGHTDAAVELDRLLADELARFADLHLGRRD